jgi:hypothetical protein
MGFTVVASVNNQSERSASAFPVPHCIYSTAETNPRAVFHVPPASVRPAPYLRVPPHCLKKTITRPSTHVQETSRSQVGSRGIVGVASNRTAPLVEGTGQPLDGGERRW